MTSGVVVESPAKIPPVCNQRAPCVPKMWSQSKSLVFSCEDAVFPRSETPRAPRTPKPRSVKFNPLRTERPMLSPLIHLISEVSTPPIKIRSLISFPTSFSASPVMIEVLSPKHFARPRATLYSPPPSHTVKLRVVRILKSPGSRRNITSPSETASN